VYLVKRKETGTHWREDKEFVVVIQFTTSLIVMRGQRERGWTKRPKSSEHPTTLFTYLFHKEKKHV
jgi:hypothetical protein